MRRGARGAGEQCAARRNNQHVRLSALRAAPLDKRNFIRAKMSDYEDDDTQENDMRYVVFPKKLLKKFILLYRELPCLWDRNCRAYKQKAKRHEAITQLTELVQRHDPTATRVHVLRKIESLRACVRREHKRVRDSRRNAKSDDNVYKPQLWYYELFSFVFGEEGTGWRNYTMKMTEGKTEPAVSKNTQLIMINKATLDYSISK